MLNHQYGFEGPGSIHQSYNITNIIYIDILFIHIYIYRYLKYFKKNQKRARPDYSSTRCRARAAMWALAARRPGPLWRGDHTARPLIFASVALATTARDGRGGPRFIKEATGEGLLSPANGVLGTL